ncbi:MAG: molybdopterin-dependent oxidoreductase, partial [Planctomycetes bacterium]|nr:molybdopterin-dependent oxidoreductase [Planctomycetota bacterium]
MPFQPKRSWIERAAVRWGLVPTTGPGPQFETLTPTGPLALYPARSEWHDFVEYETKTWPGRADERHYRLVPTTCFNCESACGLLAYVDKRSNTIRKFTGNPLHPGSRGRNCAKGPATINQVNDPDRILTPLKRAGKRGDGKWVEVSWDEVLADIGGRIRKALQEDRHDEVVYHVGRPGAEGFMDRVLRAWGIDGHNSHTNVCSSSARLGYALWCGFDRPSPDYANARFILALNSHLESGHYFNPHAQRISEGRSRGARIAVVDPRLSNTASMADYWLATRPGTESALLLAFAHVILEEQLYDRRFIERWTNWRESLEGTQARRHEGTKLQDKGRGEWTIDDFIAVLKEEYASFTPEFAEAECGIPAETIVKVAREIGAAGSRFCSHTWRGATAGHLGGWQVARCIFFLNVLTGSVGTVGGTSPSAWHKYKANLIDPPPPNDRWNELHWPREYPLAHYEMSILLPYFLKEGRGKIDVYITRVFNPVWTYPDGFSWVEVLRDESKIGLHVTLTPTWNETALFADYVLPMGHGPERHDLNTYETHNATWIAFRQPVLRAARRAEGEEIADTREVNPGVVWEEDEFWIALTWAIDPDGSMGIRKYFESKKNPGQPLSVDEYYEHIFERVPGLPEKAAAVGLSALEYMRQVGAFEVSSKVYEKHERRLSGQELDGTDTEAESGCIVRNGATVGIRIDGVAVEGFHTPSRLLEFWSPTMSEWGWEEQALPGYIRSHVYARDEKKGSGDQGIEGSSDDRGVAEFCLLPTFRLPTLIHTRSGSTKWLNEISQRNPVWIHTGDGKRMGVRTGDLVRVTTEIGYFIDRVWVTESIRPGVVACSHHTGRWRRRHDPPASRWSGSVVSVE